MAPAKDILEVQNAIKVYEQLHSFNPNKLADLEKAHGVLMKGLVDHPGKFRTKNLGIVKGSQVAHMAPDGSMVKGLMRDLFDYLKKDKEITLIKSCVFHNEFEFIHPFIDGNGRMGRLWQTLLLMQQYPVFEFLPIENLIKQRQEEYYRKLSESDNTGSSTPFVEFMLSIISDALDEPLGAQGVTMTAEERLQLFKDKAGTDRFSRKDYMQTFKSISAPTASRDLKWGVDAGLLRKEGQQRLTVYRYVTYMH